MNEQQFLERFRVAGKPNYVSHSDEVRVFEAAFASRIPMILKGPTGCGKTRFVEYMAHRLNLPLVTVSCHEDLTAADLVGRYLFRNEETVWQDGPLVLTTRYSGICYLDEIVEARKDTTVIIHSLTDDRRMVHVDKTGEVVLAHPRFMLVVSYNPGYQSVVKDLKESTKQRFASLVFGYPSAELETTIITSETGLDAVTSARLADMGAKLRDLKGFGLDEGVSTRLLVYVGRLMGAGLTPGEACRTAIVQTLTDEEEIMQSVADVVELYFGGDGDEPAEAP